MCQCKKKLKIRRNISYNLHYITLARAKYLVRQKECKSQLHILGE